MPISQIWWTLGLKARTHCYLYGSFIWHPFIIYSWPTRNLLRWVIACWWHGECRILNLLHAFIFFFSTRSEKKKCPHLHCSLRPLKTWRINSITTILKEYINIHGRTSFFLSTNIHHPIQQICTAPISLWKPCILPYSPVCSSIIFCYLLMKEHKKK